MDATLPDKPDEEQQQTKDFAVLRAGCLAIQARGNFDAVQIVATRHDAEDGTKFVSCGEGNYYARLGAVQQWVVAAKREAP